MGEYKPPEIHEGTGDTFENELNDAALAWFRNDRKQEKAAGDFTDAVDELFDNNPLSRFIDIIRISHENIARSKQAAWQEAIELRAQHLPKWVFKQVETERMAKLAELYTGDQNPEPSTYSEYLWFSGDNYASYLVERRFQGDEIFDWAIPDNLEIWVPPQSGSVLSSRQVIKYFHLDDQDRIVPVERQHKLFYKQSGTGRVSVAEHLLLPDPADYGTNEVALTIFQKDTDYVLTHPGRGDFPVGHIELEQLFEAISSSEVYVSERGSIPILDTTRPSQI